MNLRRKPGWKPVPVYTRMAPFIEKIAASQCWEWTGCLTKAGYGQIGDNHPSRKITYAHRAAWEQRNGPIPNGLFVLHKCDNRKCCNPDHLFIGTQKDNMIDARNKRRSGHYTHPDSYPTGDRAKCAKLTDAQASEMIELVKAGTPRKVAAARFGVERSLISKIFRGKARAKQFNFKTKISS